MVAYTISTPLISNVNLLSGDWLTVTRFGTILLNAGAVGLVVGAGGNAIQVDGAVSNVGAAGIGIRLTAGADAVVIGESGYVTASGIALLVEGVGSNTIRCAGLIRSYGDVGMTINGTNNAITIETAGTVWGDTHGIVASGDNTTFKNFGTLQAGVEGIRLQGGGNSVTNTGTIETGAGGGILINAASGANSIVNTGVIRSLSGGIGIQAGADSAALYNTGTVEGVAGSACQWDGTGTGAIINAGTIYSRLAYGVRLGDGADAVVNNGLIQGNLAAARLGSGADLYDGRLGVQVGLVDGEGGNDTIYGGAQSDMLAGGADNDILHGMGGNDALAGGAGIDTLFGGNGADNLMGEGGTDLIYGGAGGDVIRGGLGGDLIVFNVGDNGDLILNFNEGGTRDGFDLRGYFNATGYSGNTPRAAGIMQVLQNGADTDVYLHGAFAFRVQGVVAAAIDDSYFLFQ